MYVIIITSLKYINFDPVKTTPDNKPPITPEPAIHPNRDGAIYRATQGSPLWLMTRRAAES